MTWKAVLRKDRPDVSVIDQRRIIGREGDQTGPREPDYGKEEEFRLHVTERLCDPSMALGRILHIQVPYVDFGSAFTSL